MAEIVMNFETRVLTEGKVGSIETIGKMIDIRLKQVFGM